MTSATNDNWLEQCLAAIPRARITVFGDFCVDAYWVTEPDESELSVETGLPVRRVRQQRYSLGGAGNIVANLVDIGVGSVRVVGLIGDDLFGRLMLDLMRRIRVDVAGLLQCQADWQTLVYAKPCFGDAELNRIDFGGFNLLAPPTIATLAAELDKAAGESELVILNQQVPGGVATAEMIAAVNEIIARHPKTMFIVDSRHRAELYRGCMLKLNAHEAARLLGRPRPLDERIAAADARQLAGELVARTGKTVFVTRGENGLLVAQPGGTITEVPGIQIVSQVDTVGAGDTTLSAIGAVLASGGDALTAGTLANIAASITVRKLQTTGTASPDELRAVGPTPDYVYLPELADDPRQARYIEGTEIEIVREIHGRDAHATITQHGRDAHATIRHAIFDHDGTISTLREGWEQIMEPMMIRAILGPAYDTADERLYHKVVDTVRKFIDKTTGIQTLIQMQGLVELVRQFKCCPERNILDIHGYKALYNEALLSMVSKRVDKLRRGELASEDFQIKNARKWLEMLHGRGVKLYLASGTDEQDVIAEATAMGYADLFEGRIFGAVGDIKVEAKAVVLRRIFEENGLSGPEVATFGDGPVEMRLTRKRGGVAVGIASDEPRRYGHNPVKRARLIRAGADVIVPDFSQLEQLQKYLIFDT